MNDNLLEDFLAGMQNMEKFLTLVEENKTRLDKKLHDNLPPLWKQYVKVLFKQIEEKMQTL